MQLLPATVGASRKMLNPYQSPTTPPAEERHDRNRRILIALVPFAIAAVAVPLAIWAWSRKGELKETAPTIFGIAGSVFVFDLAVCVWVIVHWLQTGNPPSVDQYLSGLVASREERDFRRRLKQRPRLDDEELFRTYFTDTGIPSELPAR